MRGLYARYRAAADRVDQINGEGAAMAEALATVVSLVTAGVLLAVFAIMVGE